MKEKKTAPVSLIGGTRDYSRTAPLLIQDKSHKELMEVVTTMMTRNDIKSFRIETFRDKFVLATSRELTSTGSIGLKFGDLVNLNNDIYSETLGVYLGKFSEQTTTDKGKRAPDKKTEISNNKKEEHWFLAQGDKFPHYYGDLEAENLAVKGIEMNMAANAAWIKKILGKI